MDRTRTIGRCTMVKDLKSKHDPEIRADWEQLCAANGIELPAFTEHERRTTREMHPELLRALVEATKENV